MGQRLKEPNMYPYKWCAVCRWSSWIATSSQLYLRVELFFQRWCHKNWSEEMNPRPPMVVLRKRNLSCSVAEQQSLPANRAEKPAPLTCSNFQVDKLIYHCKPAPRQEQCSVSVLRPGDTQLLLIAYKTVGKFIYII